jgi:hypothetical protein
MTTFGHEDSLPRLPVADLEDACARYLKSLRPLLDDEAFAASEAHVQVNDITKDMRTTFNSHPLIDVEHW